MFEFIYLTTPAHLWLILHSYVTSNFSAKLCVLAAKPIIIRCSSPPHSQHVMRLALRLWFQTWQTSPMAFCLWGNLTQSHHRQESCVCVSLSHSLPLFLFLHVTKWLTFMADTTVAKRVEIFILILLKTGIFERKNAIIVAGFQWNSLKWMRSPLLCISRGFVQYCFSYFVIFTFDLDDM